MISKKKEKVHFIAIGGSVMHSLAIALKMKGLEVTGSDDNIYNPSKKRLEDHGLLPKKLGWDEAHISEDLDAVILGMHARDENPELRRARALGLPIYSFPEYIRKQSDDKQRIVIAGSHGKTTITAMIMHVLNYANRDFDYVVGAHLDGFHNIVKLSDAPIIIIEGDEYFSSALDKTPKFLNYEHHIGLISGIAWDHINAYETVDEYVKQFEIFADSTPKGGTLIFCEEDDMAMVIASNQRTDVVQLHYPVHPYVIKNEVTYLKTETGLVPIKVFGQHNMLNLNGARRLLSRIGITDDVFYEAISSFEGASKRLQLLKESRNTSVFLDFAHAPSKVEATTSAFKERYSRRKLVACLELHTFSSLNKKFINNYQDTLKAADEACIYFNPQNNKQKSDTKIDAQDVENAFNFHGLEIFTNIEDLENCILGKDWQDSNLLLMSSGHFGNMDLLGIATKIIDSTN
ncbi:MAG: Mur ligase domain-containing protein [Cytophagales bacterium]|nr:Mur ligase domain-containing protein [Cytophagales bacterium]